MQLWLIAYENLKIGLISQNDTLVIAYDTIKVNS